MNKINPNLIDETPVSNQQTNIMVTTIMEHNDKNLYQLTY